MKKKSKITGEIDEIDIIEISIPKDKIIGVVTHQDGVQCKFTYSRRTFNEEWEDYEEPKKGLTKIMWEGNKIKLEYNDNKAASKDYKKLRAWKRLKDKGFRFEGYDNVSGTINWRCEGLDCSAYELQEDLDTCFGGEE